RHGIAPPTGRLGKPENFLPVPGCDLTYSKAKLPRSCKQKGCEAPPGAHWHGLAAINRNGCAVCMARQGEGLIVFSSGSGWDAPACSRASQVRGGAGLSPLDSSLPGQTACQAAPATASSAPRSGSPRSCPRIPCEVSSPGAGSPPGSLSPEPP